MNCVEDPTELESPTKYLKYTVWGDDVFAGIYTANEITLTLTMSLLISDLKDGSISVSTNRRSFSCCLVSKLKTSEVFKRVITSFVTASWHHSVSCEQKSNVKKDLQRKRKKVKSCWSLSD
uniref:Uncharacterized protein n=1 Tax=Glossina pallidipes TaxID=7398 RepID=A0A1A9Z8H0_GLOPL